MNASLVCGNPKNPCAGAGICDFQLSDIASELAMTVSLSTKGDDLTITIPADQVGRLQSTRRSIYNDLEALQFKFDHGAMPFYLDYYISQQLWPQGSHYNKLESTECSVEKQADGSFKINFPQVTFNGSGTPYGSVGSIDGEYKSAAQWQIGQDVYGNLVFKNPNNMVVLGAQNNMSCMRYSVQATGDVVNESSWNNIVQLSANWWAGMDPNRNLIISNNFNYIAFGHDSAFMTLQGHTLITQPAQHPIANVSPDYPGGHIEIGDYWDISPDAYGNLLIASSNTKYFFGASHDIYVGTGNTVKTYFPSGGNTAES